MEVTNKYITIKSPIDSAPQESDFELKTTVSFSLLVKQGCKDVIVKNLYISIDPYQIMRMKTCRHFAQKGYDLPPRIAPGEIIDAYGVGKVVASGNPEFKKGDYVKGFLSWAEYTVSQGAAGILTKFEPVAVLSYHVGILGLNGLTAYVGFHEICKPKKGDKVFVSAACGSIGNLVGQYAKLFGCYVVGCAGSPKKVNLLKEKLGFDEAFNYKEEIDLNVTLARYFPDGIDIYFDNVGANLLEASISNMKHYGRIAICGNISEYVDVGKRTTPDFLDVIFKRLTIRGFLTLDYLSVFPEFVSTTADHIRAGKMQVLEDMSVGLESVPSAFIGIFRGDNVGKRIVQVWED